MQSDILKDFFLHSHNFTFESFAQENGEKISKLAHKVGKNGQQSLENNKIMNFPVSHTILKTLRRVREILRRRTTVRW